ncbi:uncharacterized protein LOC121745883 [Salvia splendens]|uniref:uncharacterized protein LOC121745883 n=1 Tax=Salvia splendens TaxID=180675 RepID=UPI001C25DB95|nr:uncharacterized protein LOC121745883 [Salvia splendens]
MNLQFKLIRIKKFPKVWNRAVFGNIHQNLKNAKEAVLEARILYDSVPTPAHRAGLSRVSAELLVMTKMEEGYWTQKAAVRWAADGERNSKSFHGWVRQKRVKLRIHMIEAGGRELCDCSHWGLLSGAFMPRSFTATMIILIPMKPNPVMWGGYRPISLCNVTNKIITKILASRLAPLLPLVIASNHSGFIKGRLLSDNALFAQDLINDLGKKLSSRGRSPNLALMLDMAKAYDRVQWPFLLKVLEKMGFSPT